MFKLSNMGSQKITFVVVVILAIYTSSSMAQLQPPPLQDFCVADFNSTLLISGPLPCKDPKKVEDTDFVHRGVIPVAVVSILPGLNTLGLQLITLSFGPSDLNPPHFHPRGTELVYVLDGTLEAGFVTSGPEHRLFSKILTKGDVFVVPFGLNHFQLNVGKGNATAEILVFFNSDNPGDTDMQPVLFAAEPQLPVDLLAKTLRVDENIIQQLLTAAN